MKRRRVKHMYMRIVEPIVGSEESIMVEAFIHAAMRLLARVP